MQDDSVPPSLSAKRRASPSPRGIFCRRNGRPDKRRRARTRRGLGRKNRRPALADPGPGRVAVVVFEVSENSAEKYYEASYKKISPVTSFVFQRFGRIRPCRPDRLISYGQDRDRQGKRGRQKRRLDPRIHAVGKSSQPAPDRKLRRRPGDGVGRENPDGEFAG